MNYSTEMHSFGCSWHTGAGQSHDRIERRFNVFAAPPMGRERTIGDVVPGFCCASSWANLLSSLREGGLEARQFGCENRNSISGVRRYGAIVGSFRAAWNPLPRITLSSARAGPLGYLVPRSNWEA